MRHVSYRASAWLLVAMLLMLPLPVATASTTTAQLQQVAAPFRAYYADYQGLRVLGAPLSGLVEIDGRAAQYFEKGRLEDHRGAVTDAQWAFMYGRLTAELIADSDRQALPVNATGTTYGDLKQRTLPMYRQPVPADFTTGTHELPEGVFVPYEPQLRAAPGYIVPAYFWQYINQTRLFPGGWLHDLGLPMTDALVADTVKDGKPRQIMMQAFERTILTYDPLNPPAWQIERGNIGADVLTAATTSATIEQPRANTRITLPLPLLARVGAPGQQIEVTLRWKNGVTLRRTLTTLGGEDGSGLLIANLDWQTESQPPQPAARGALLELRSQTGALLAQQPLEVLRWDDPEAQQVTVYWLLNDQLQAVQRTIPPTIRTGRAALDELLWGPRPGNLAGFRSAIPSPEEVLRSPYRGADWGPRVTVRDLVIQHGVATVDFSPELWAYGGDPVRGQQIRAQITRTLLQFPSIQGVYILIDGQSKNVL